MVALSTAQSLADAKLAEHRVENLFHIHDANDLADCAQRLIKINRNVPRRIIPRSARCGHDRMIPRRGGDNRDDEY